MKLEHQDIWRGSHRGIQSKIVNWDKGADYTPGSEGIWNCYIYIPESKAANFESLWLPDIAKRWSPNSPERISHDYYAPGFPFIEMHGGITYYAKHGHTPGHRRVEVGCDYSHLWDHERGGGYTHDSVAGDAVAAIDALYDSGIIKREETP